MLYIKFYVRAVESEKNEKTLNLINKYPWLKDLFSKCNDKNNQEAFLQTISNADIKALDLINKYSYLQNFFVKINIHYLFKAEREAFLEIISNNPKVVDLLNKHLYLQNIFKEKDFSTSPIKFLQTISDNPKAVDFLDNNPYLHNMLEKTQSILQKIKFLKMISGNEKTLNLINKYPWLQDLFLQCISNDDQEAFLQTISNADIKALDLINKYSYLQNFFVKINIHYLFKTDREVFLEIISKTDIRALDLINQYSYLQNIFKEENFSTSPIKFLQTISNADIKALDLINQYSYLQNIFFKISNSDRSAFLQTIFNADIKALDFLAQELDLQKIFCDMDFYNQNNLLLKDFKNFQDSINTQKKLIQQLIEEKASKKNKSLQELNLAIIQLKKISRLLQEFLHTHKMPLFLKSRLFYNDDKTQQYKEEFHNQITLKMLDNSAPNDCLKFINDSTKKILDHLLLGLFYFTKEKDEKNIENIFMDVKNKNKITIEDERFQKFYNNLKQNYKIDGVNEIKVKSYFINQLICAQIQKQITGNKQTNFLFISEKIFLGLNKYLNDVETQINQIQLNQTDTYDGTQLEKDDIDIFVSNKKKFQSIMQTRKDFFYNKSVIGQEPEFLQKEISSFLNEVSAQDFEIILFQNNIILAELLNEACTYLVNWRRSGGDTLATQGISCEYRYQDLWNIEKRFYAYLEILEYIKIETDTEKKNKLQQQFDVYLEIQKKIKVETNTDKQNTLKQKLREYIEAQQDPEFKAKLQKKPGLRKNALQRLISDMKKEL